MGFTIEIEEVETAATTIPTSSAIASLGETVAGNGFGLTLLECSYRDQYHHSAWGYMYPKDDDAVFIDATIHIENSNPSTSLTIDYDDLIAYDSRNEPVGITWLFAEYIDHGNLLDKTLFPYIKDEYEDDLVLEKNQDAYIRPIFIVRPLGESVFLKIGSSPKIDVTKCNQ